MDRYCNLKKKLHFSILFVVGIVVLLSVIVLAEGPDSSADISIEEIAQGNSDVIGVGEDGGISIEEITPVSIPVLDSEESSSSGEVYVILSEIVNESDW